MAVRPVLGEHAVQGRRVHRRRPQCDAQVVASSSRRRRLRGAIRSSLLREESLLEGSVEPEPVVRVPSGVARGIRALGRRGAEEPLAHAPSVMTAPVPRLVTHQRKLRLL